MTVMYSEPPPTGGWTTDDLDSFPEDGVRRELIDGALHVPPSPTAPHQTLAALLTAALYRDCPDEYSVTQGVEIRVSNRRSFIPDVEVVTAEASRRRPSRFDPREVILAVEIVSPGSQAMDRVLKPALYAEAGIPYFWRIETEGGVSLHAYQLSASADLYVPAGDFDKVIDLDRPWSIRIPLAEITPRGI